MKPHLCFLNYSKWSPMIDGYGGGIQVKVCTVCNKEQARTVSYGKQVKSTDRNSAVEELLKDSK